MAVYDLLTDLISARGWQSVVQTWIDGSRCLCLCDAPVDEWCVALWRAGLEHAWHDSTGGRIVSVITHRDRSEAEVRQIYRDRFAHLVEG